MQYDAGGAPYFVLQDANYNLTGLTTGSGVVHQQYSFGPYGELLAAEDGQGTSIDFVNAPQDIASPFGFHTAWYDAETGLICIRHRCYDPVTGRWMSADPNGTGIVLNPSLTYNARRPVAVVRHDAKGPYADGLHPYEFVGSQPIDRRDPSGLFFWSGESEDLLLSRDWDDIYESVTGYGHAYLGPQGAATFGSFWGENVTMLPRLAGKVKGLSQGFSDFADYYAEQVIYLPVEGAFAGLATFSVVAGAASPRGPGGAGSRLIRLAKGALKPHRHHPLPKFLGGNRLQALVKLPKHLHEAFHDLLRQKLRGKGFPKRLFGGPSGSRAEWLRHFRQNPGTQRVALDAVLEASREIDRKHGTELVQAVWQEIMDQAYRSIP